MTSILFLAVLLVVSVHGAIHRISSDPSEEFASYIELALENFRAVMPTGIPDINLPPIDPLVIRDKVVDETIKNSVILMKIPILRLEGLSSFKSNIAFKLDGLQTDIHLNFEKPLTATGEYFLDGKVIRIFPIYGNGSFTITCDKASIHLQGHLMKNPGDIALNLKGLDIKWSGFTLNLQNFMGGGSMGQIIQAILPIIGQKLFQLLNPKILTLIDQAVNNLLAKQMARPEVQEFLQGLLGGGVLFS